jgi:hypothetical protein
VEEKEEEAQEKEQAEAEPGVIWRVTRKLLPTLFSLLELQSSGLVDEKEEEAKEKAEVTGCVARRFSLLCADAQRERSGKVAGSLSKKESNLCHSYLSLSKPNAFHRDYAPKPPCSWK